MTILGKVIFFISAFMGYFLVFKVSDNYKKIKALHKLFLILISFLMFYSIIFNENLILFFTEFFGINNVGFTILYLFIIISISINFIFLRKFFEMENKLNKIVQEIALQNSPKI